MSRSIVLTGTYYNNRTNSIGLHNPKNSELLESKFTQLELDELKSKYLKYFCGKRFRQIGLNLNVSDCNGKTFEYGKYIELNDNNYNQELEKWFNCVNEK